MAITYGTAGQPAQSTFNYDALFSASLAAYKPTLTDNISTSNIFFNKMRNKMWKSQDGGLYIIEDLMYGLAPVDSYDSYDELPLTPTEGITQAQYQWRQIVAPVSISEKERKMNKHRIINLIGAKLDQATIGIQEAFAKFFLQGSLAGGGSSLITPYVSPVNGSSSIDPIGTMIAYANTATLSIGGIDQGANVWWRNQSKTSAASTTTGYLQEVLNLFNSCSKGPGGTPNMGMADQTSWELLSVAYYNRFRTEATQVGDYPFPVLRFQGCDVGWDQYMPNVDAGTIDPTTANGGTLYFMNDKFINMVYESETNFEVTEFARPVNQDAKYRHVLWMGNATTNNRRKQGVLGKIPRTLTVS